MAGWISATQQQRDHNGLRNVCAACGQDGTQADPLVVDEDGSRIHLGHTLNPGSGMFGTRQRA